MKILGGRYKGRQLKDFTDKGIRPTCGLVKESLFNICQCGIEGARFLDLFAGTGSVGFEALSRGAAHTTFVDGATRAVRLIRENAQKLQVESEVMVIHMDVWKAVRFLSGRKQQFDCVYVDPPYKLKEADVIRCLSLLHELQLIADGGSVFLEYVAKDPLIIGHVDVVGHRKLGGSYLTQYQFVS